MLSIAGSGRVDIDSLSTSLNLDHYSVNIIGGGTMENGVGFLGGPLWLHSHLIN